MLNTSPIGAGMVYSKIVILKVDTMNGGNGIWISWETQRRNYGISKALGFKLFECDIKKSRVIRYLQSICFTIKIILKEKPKIIVVQNPSIVLVVTAIALKAIINFKLVMDAHNSGIIPLDGRIGILLRVSKWIQRRCDIVIVTNLELKKIVSRNFVNAFILPDKIPEERKIHKINLNNKFSVAYICTFANDEPYSEVISSASFLNKDVTIYITGNSEGRLRDSELPSNIVLTGYLQEDDYWRLLKSVNVVMDLTLREGCLVCGAYEGIAVGQPLILSDTKVNRDYFCKGCAYVAPNAISIKNGIEFVQEYNSFLRKEISDLKSELIIDWNIRINQLSRMVNE
jgi:glycosyltransferase involved in cell wall biosynthesis